MSEKKTLRHDGKISRMTAAARKQELRKRLKAERADLRINLEDASDLMQHLAELCIMNGARRIACYLPYGNEPDTELFVDWALENQIEVLIPVSQADGTLKWVIFNGETHTGIFGFAEPVGPAVEPLNVDIAVIPALAVDRTGNRLGKGKGYYDRALKKFEPMPAVVAVVHRHEFIEKLDTETHDHPVDAVATADGISLLSSRLK
jgi:5-formyltetrahydrofolate cyclo-ligase